MISSPHGPRARLPKPPANPFTPVQRWTLAAEKDGDLSQLAAIEREQGPREIS